ncbi:MAG: fumarylacetoacetate hydrolase [Dactylosporangium sp.]|jgi:2-keto-4-pentenoate hydratase/2-oxohepta-3-ene-1,7-dioic acid hydratase in catechol pathway|nr:fumarylacetoacetate hydrolase [Dactylosporangium sp.]
MQYAMVELAGRTGPALVDQDRGLLPAWDILVDAPTTVAAILGTGRLAEWLDRSSDAPSAAWRDPEEGVYLSPVQGAQKILGIGLNYSDHASDLNENVPTEPASFPKWPHTLIGPGEKIPLPADSSRVTAEAELGVVFGRYCRNVQVAEALDYVLGFVPVLDQTAEDVLQRNPRFLTRSKNYPGFLSCGPTIVPRDDVLEAVGSLADLRVTTVLNGHAKASNVGAAMTFGVRELVSFHSKVMPFFPGDVILTGTPGAVVIRDGDMVAAQVEGVGTLTNFATRH